MISGKEKNAESISRGFVIIAAEMMSKNEMREDPISMVNLKTRYMIKRNIGRPKIPESAALSMISVLWRLSDFLFTACS